MPFLVLVMGGGALSVCFNTVAVLFLCDIDNITYDRLMSERVRSRIEERGRVEIDDAEAQALSRSKAVHAFLLSVSVPCVVLFAPTILAGDVGWGGFVITLVPFVVFWLAGAVEAIANCRIRRNAASGGGGAAGACISIAKATGAFMLGLVVFAIGQLYHGRDDIL